MRKPKRKKSKFVFKTKAGTIIVKNDNIVWRRHIRSIIYMGDFAYHGDAADVFTVFHVPTGLDIAYFDEEKNARVLIKKLFVKIEKIEWDIKNPNAFDLTLQLMSLILNIKKTLNVESMPILNKNFVPNPDDDIPF